MSLLLIAQHRDMIPFKKAIQQSDPNIDVEVWPSVAHPERVQFAVAWNQPKNIFTRFPNLKAISSLGAGVDHLLSDETIPDSLPLLRVVTPSLTNQMCDYVLTSVLNLIRNTHLYFYQQNQSKWVTHPSHKKTSITIGIMGLGELGLNTALNLQRNGFSVIGWSRSKKNIEEFQTFGSDEFDQFLEQTNIVVCLLPLTPKTDGILNLNLFKKLKQPAFLINAARGEHLVEEDLIYALDTDLITHATLDVFSTEPLPDSHSFWGRKKITITPHIASVTDPTEVADLLIDNYKRVLSGMELNHRVERKRGY